MTQPSSAEAFYLNTEPQLSDLYLSIYEPEVAFICSISGSSYNKDSQTIAYNSTITGSYGNIQDYHFQVALIGKSANDDSLGRTWVRSVSSNTLRFVESDHINWSEASVITVLKYTEIIPVFPRTIQNPADEEKVIFYKIWDVPYTNQNSILGTFVCMGSNYAGFLDGGTGTCYWSASGTSNLLDESLSYSWIFEGATITGSSDHTPGYVAYNQPGHHRTILRVTSTSGRTDTSIRYASFYDRPGVGKNVPILNWELRELSGHRDSIGYTCRIIIRENIPRTKLRDGSLVIIFGEDYYGNTKYNINNNELGRSNIKFVGYIVSGTIQYDYIEKFVEFECVSPTNFMELCECFSCSVESKRSPSLWIELLNMSVKRAVYHYLAWQSSVLLCCDVEFRNFIDRDVQYFDADRTSLFDAVNTFVDNTRVGKLVSDSLGKLWFEQDVSAIHDANTLPTALNISKKDWIEQPVIEEAQEQELSHLECRGVYFVPSTRTSTALISDAPGVSPAYRGKLDIKDGMVVSSQLELNTMAGDLFAYANSRYRSVELKMRANINNVDIAPQEKVLLSIASGDTPRNIVFSNKAFAVRGKAISWDASSKRLIVSLSLSEITSGYLADTVIIPIEPPEPPINPPKPKPPPEPPPLPKPLPLPISSGTAVVIQADDVRVTPSLSDPTPSWIDKTSADPTAPIDSSLPPQQSTVFFVLEDTKVWKTSNLTIGTGVATWEEIYSSSDFETASQGQATDVHFVRIHAPTTALVYVLGYAFVGGISTPWMFRSQNGGQTWSAFKVDNNALSTKPYTVTYRTDLIYKMDNDTEDNIHIHERIGDDENTYSPWGMATRVKTEVQFCRTEGYVTGCSDLDWSYMKKAADTINDWVGGVPHSHSSDLIFGVINSLLSGEEKDGVKGWLDDYFGPYDTEWFSESLYNSLPKDPARVKIDMGLYHSSILYHPFDPPPGPWGVRGESWVFWNKPSSTMPRAFDYADTNHNWLYVGLDQKIRASEDGGQTWFDFTTESAGNGANDLRVDPQNANAVYIWSDTGNLDLWLKDTEGLAGTKQLSAIMTETPNTDFLRIAKNHTGIIWAIPNGSEIIKRENSGNVAQLTGTVSGRGLHYYYDGHLIFEDDTEIYVSDDNGVTWTAKKGDWSTYAEGINGHRIIDL